MVHFFSLHQEDAPWLNKVFITLDSRQVIRPS